MTGSACRNVPFWDPIFEDLLSCLDELSWGPANRSGVKVFEFCGKRLNHLGAENMRDAKHNIICPPALDEGLQLIL
jgi:hypothetical protein